MTMKNATKFDMKNLYNMKNATAKFKTCSKLITCIIK